MPSRKETTVAFHTLGCKVNQYESDHLASRFLQAGYRVCALHEAADVYVINTCTVTNEADRKSRQMIRRAARSNRGSLVVVTGCHAAAWEDKLEGCRVLKVDQLQKETLFSQVEEVLFGASPDMPDALDYHTTPAGLTGRESSAVGRTRAYLKVQDGCDRFCTYCIIPYVRGRSRSRLPEEILAEARKLIAAGVLEIVVTGICAGDYGRDLKPRQTLSGLLESLLSLPYDGRFRLSSFDPCDMDGKLFDFLTTHPRLCRHLHLALQHGSDRILRRMGRDYTRQEFYILCRELKKRAPDFAITTDIIAGFPGETQEDFDLTVSLAKAAGFSKIHVFPYSPRKGTGAVKHPGQVSPSARGQRARALSVLSEDLAEKFQRSFAGSCGQVLVEQERDRKTGGLEGYTSNYLPVVFPGGDALMGRIVPVRLTGVEGGKVLGKIPA